MKPNIVTHLCYCLKMVRLPGNGFHVEEGEKKRNGGLWYYHSLQRQRQQNASALHPNSSDHDELHIYWRGSGQVTRHLLYYYYYIIQQSCFLPHHLEVYYITLHYTTQVRYYHHQLPLRDLQNENQLFMGTHLMSFQVRHYILSHFNFQILIFFTVLS